MVSTDEALLGCPSSALRLRRLASGERQPLRDSPIVSAIIDMGRNLKQRVIAEGNCQPLQGTARRALMQG